MSRKRGSLTARIAATVSGPGLSTTYDNFDLLVSLTEHAVYRTQREFRSIEGRDNDGNQHRSSPETQTREIASWRSVVSLNGGRESCRASAPSSNRQLASPREKCNIKWPAEFS